MSIIIDCPPAPDPKTTPTSVRFSSVISKPESARACLAAATPKCMLDSLRRTALGSIHSVALKSRTSPASLASYGVVSNLVIWSRPERPWTRFDQAVGDVVADRADDTEAGDDDAAVVVGSAQVDGSFFRCGFRRRWRVREGDRPDAASSAATASASGAMRRMRPVSTLPGPTSMNVGDAGGGHALDGADPVDAGGEVLDELRPARLGGRDRARIGVGEERRGRDRGTGRRRARHASPRPPRAISGEWAATETGRTMARLRAEGLRDLGGGLDRGAFAARRRPGPGRSGWRRRRRRGPRPPATSSGRRASSRPMSAAIAPSRPAPDACIRRPRSRTRRTPSARRDRAGRDERRVLAHRVAGGERRLRRPRPAAAQRSRSASEERDRGREQRRLRVLGQVEPSAGPSQASALRSARRARHRPRRRPRRQPGMTAARTRPIPTDCEPWPGKTKANVDIVRRGVVAHDAPTAPIRVHALHGSRSDAVRFRTCPRRVPPAPSIRPPPPAPIARRFEADLSAPVLAAGNRLPNVRQISERVAMGRALWRELVIGFAAPARRAAARLHPAGRALRPRRRRDDDDRRAGRGDRPLAVGDEPAHRRARPAPARRARTRSPRTGDSGRSGSPSAGRRCCASSTGRGRTSSCRPSGRCRPRSGRSSRWAWPRSRPMRSRPRTADPRRPGLVAGVGFPPGGRCRGSRVGWRS